MLKVLSAEAIENYRRDGYHYPLSVLDENEVADNRQKLETFEAEQGHPVEGGQRSKSYLLFKWVDDLMRHPRILDGVEDLIGPDILCWNTIFWVKEKQSKSFISWHQDSNYWGLDTNDLVTVWLALSPATEESGCMWVLPGSHNGEALPHRDTFHDDNMLTRGQEIDVEVDDAKTVPMPLQPGQVSFHNIRIAHTSGPNNSGDRRIGLSLHYMPTRTKQVIGEWDTAALVRGQDAYGNFVLPPRPEKDFDPACVDFHEQATEATRKVLFHGAEKIRTSL